MAEGSSDLIDEPEAVEALDEALRNAIRDQAVADVPVGAFLSGGIDSSSIVALYQAVSNQQVRTYTIAFDDPEYDESKHARRVAEHLGTHHREFSVTVAEAREVIPLLPTIYDEPFADSSQIPTYLVSKLARQEVTVGLTGDGGDELFGGYHRHVMAPRFWKRLASIPGPVRTAVFGPVAYMPTWALAGAGAAVGLSPKARSPEVIRKFARVASQASGFDDVADSFVDEWYGMKPPVSQIVVADVEHRALPLSADLLTQITYRDAISYLPDDILVKVDRASMAVSLETRVPFLDHRVVALAARIPSRLKVERGSGKAILRTLLARHLPRESFERPKAGFGIPVGDWVRGPLRDWAEALLDERRLLEDGLLNVAVVRKRWAEHLSGRRSSTSAIWAMLMFQGWRESMGGSSTASRMLNA